MAVFLSIRAPSGQILSTRRLGGALQTIPAQEQVQYVLADENGLAAQAQAERAGADLLVKVGGEPVLRIEGYFLLDGSGLNNPLLGMNGSGHYVAYPVSEAAAVPSETVLAAEVGVGEAASSGSLFSPWAVAALGGAVLAGAAVAAGGKSGSTEQAPANNGQPAPPPNTGGQLPTPPSGGNGNPPPVPHPVPNASISISGSPKAGHTLSARIHDPDGVAGSPVFQWFADGKPIAGATRSSYTLTQADAGKSISVQALYTDRTQVAESPVSPATAPVGSANRAPADITLSSLTVAEGQSGAVVGRLAAIDPDAGDSHRYQVSDARFEVVNGSLKLKAGQVLNHDEAPQIALTVRAEDSQGGAISKTFTLQVQDNPAYPAPAPNRAGRLDISGQAKSGQTLSTELHDADGISGSPAFQWFADGKPIAGATQSQYTLGHAEVGKSISVHAAYTDQAGQSEQPQSAATEAVRAAKESGAMLDMGRHFYSPAVIKQYIDTIAQSGGTFLHLHLSGDDNYALESHLLGQRADNAVLNSQGIYTNPKTGKPFLSFAQLQDIVQHAKAQGVELVPEIDSPAHMGGIFALLDAAQVAAIQSPVLAGQLNYTGDQAIAFIRALIGEVAGQFGDSSRHFHIGGDEFGYSVANHHEYVAYANLLAGYLKTLGLTPRMWNDGVIKSALSQFDAAIQITYWDYDGFMDNNSADPAQIAERRAVRADMPELLEAGFQVLNYNSYYLYATPDSGHGATSEPGNFAERDILKNWHLGVWDGNNHANAVADSSKIAGAALAVWGEHAGTLSDETVYRYTAGHLDAVIRKTNAAADSKLAEAIAAETANGFYRLDQEVYLDFAHIADNAVVDLRYNGKQTLKLLQEELLNEQSALDIWVRADTRHDTRGDAVVLKSHWQKTGQTDSQGSGWAQENYTAYEYRGNKLWLDDDIVITWI